MAGLGAMLDEGFAESLATTPIFDLLSKEEIRPLGLKSSDGRYDFRFVEEKSFFTLGVEQADFIVKDQGVTRKHLVFLRDINGINLILCPGQKALLNEEEVFEPQLLKHQDIIHIGELKLVFYDGALGEIKKNQASMAKNTQDKILLKVFDGLFIVAFLLVLLGALRLYFGL